MNLINRPSQNEAFMERPLPVRHQVSRQTGLHR